MRLVIIDENNIIVSDYGDFTVSEADAFFHDAFAAMEFRKSFPEVMVRNEAQLHLLTDTFNKMGLLHGNPEAIEAWMRPYIKNEIERQSRRQNIFQRAKAKIGEYQDQAWDWIKSEIFGGVAKLFTKILNKFKK